MSYVLKNGTTYSSSTCSEYPPVHLLLQVQCICPAFADTAIIDDADGGKTYRQTLEKNFGILT